MSDSYGVASIDVTPLLLQQTRQYQPLFIKVVCDSQLLQEESKAIGSMIHAYGVSSNLAYLLDVDGYGYFQQPSDGMGSLFFRRFFIF